MKNLWIILLSACVGALLSTMLTRSCQVEPPLPEMMVLRDTITEVYIDTNTAYKPVPYKVEVRDTVYLDKPYKGHVFTQQTKWFSDNCTYDMQISGINVQLDWIKTYPKIVHETITETKTEKVYIQPKKWSLWLNADYMYIGKKSHLPISGELRYAENEHREYNIKLGNELISGQTFVLVGTSIKLF